LRRRRSNSTKQEIIQTATHLFLENGYRATSPRMICDALDISTGNMTYYFPTKEHILAELVDMLCSFQWKKMEEEANDGYSSVMAICLELTTMAAASEEDPVIKDFFLSSYQSAMCLEIIRKNDARRAKEVFADYCSHWTQEQFAEAELLVSGIEYATLMTAGDPISLETRVEGALHNILGIYGVPQELRKSKIRRVFDLDYRKLGKQTLDDFRQYVAQANDQAFQDLQKH